MLAGLVLHLRSSAGVSVAGGRVTSWADGSGMGNHLQTSGSPALDPALTPSGRAAILLDGVDDGLAREDATDPLQALPAGNSDRTMFVVARYRGSSGSGGVAYGTAVPNQAFGLGVRHPDGSLFLQGYESGADLESTTVGIGAGWICQTTVLEAGLATLFQDKTPLARWSHVYDTVPSRLVIGQEIGGPGFVAMDVAAVLVYERALTPAEREAVGDFLRAEYLAPGGPNAAPTVAIRSPSAPLLVEPGTLVRLEATAADAEEGNLGSAIRWRSDRDGELGTGTTLETSTLSLGAHAITASVTDEGGLTDGATVFLTVDSAPEVTITAPADGSSVEAGTSVTLEGSASDAGDGDLSASLAWRSDRDGALGTGASVTTSTLSVGTHAITAAVTDGLGLTGEATLALTIVPASPPRVEIAGPGIDAVVAQGVFVRLTATASDVRDGDLSSAISWSSSLDGPLGTGASLESATLSVGAHAITAAVTNAAGSTGRSSVDVIVSDVALVPASSSALFDGRSLAGLQSWFADTAFEDPDGVFRVEDGVLRVSGKHLGGLATLAAYRDYAVVLEFRWGTETWDPRLDNARDAGLLLHGHGAEGEWRSRFLPSIQAQMMEGGTGDVILLEGNTPILATAFSDQVPCVFDTWNCRGGFVWNASGPARSLRGFPDVPTLHWEHWDPAWVDEKGFRGVADLESPVGDWNQLVVEAAGNRLDVFLNGVKVNEIVDVSPSSGRIQLESESAEYFVRRLELLPLGAPVGPTIATHALPSAITGLDYDAPVKAVGSAAPFTWTLASGALPPGLTLDGALGTIAGRPTVAGAFAPVLHVTDARGVAAESAFALDVRPPVTAPPTGGLVLRLESSEFTSAGAVSSWSDQSGMGNHVFAAGDPMVALAATPSGQPAILLAGLDDTLERVHATHSLNGLPTGNADRSLFVVSRLDACNASAGVAWGRGASNQAFGLIVRHPSGLLTLQGFGNSEDLVSSTPGIGAGWIVQSVVLAAGHATVFRDGQPIAEWDHVYDTQLEKLALGEEIAGLGHLDAALAAVLLYDRALGDAERTEAETFLSAKYLR